jgi:hypothetical protein
MNFQVMKKYIIIITILTQFCQFLWAELNIRKTADSFQSDLVQTLYLRENLSGREEIAFCSAALLSGIMIGKYDPRLVDKLLYQDEKKFKNQILHSLSKRAYWYGNSADNVLYTWAILSAGLAGTGVITDNPGHYKTFRLLTESFIITSLYTGLAKVILGRERPNVPDSRGRFLFFEKATRHRSMPSGHTAAAFTFATVLAESYDKLYVKIPAYTLAVCAGLERIEHRKHWVSDVIIGGLIGYYIGQTITMIHNQNGSQIKINSQQERSMTLKLSFPL